MTPDTLFATATALGGVVAGFLVAWGTMRATIAQLRREVDELRSDVKRLNALAVRLATQLAVLTDRDERDSGQARARVVLEGTTDADDAE